MAQPQSPRNPTPNPYPNPNTTVPPTTSAAAPPPSKADPTQATATVTSTLKRRRDEDGTEADAEAGTSADVPAAKRREKATHDVIYRIVVPSRQIGKVIGKAGHRIQKIREDTKATIKIADAISRHEERVIIISSKDSDSIFSDAENALHQIVSLILKDDGGNVEEVNVGAGHVAANTIRLLIAGSQAGGLIGVSGQNIENLRNTSGATITVLSPSQLPPCASAHESDRVVQISGDIPVVLRAVVEIGCQLRDNPPKQVISISPTYNVSLHRQPQQYVDPTSGNHVLCHTGNLVAALCFLCVKYPYVSLDDIILRTTHLAAEYVTLDLMVPENLVGGLIGRFGANISRIRNESGADIKVYGGRGEQTQRQIRLSGNAQQITLARQRVDEYVYAELMRQAGGQLQPTVGQLQQVVAQQPTPDMSNSLYQGYAHAHALYANSSYDVGTMTSHPPMYASTATNQVPPPYYGYQPYPAPPQL
ncbi:hypothetical protein ACJIZ3_007812 [Penstemon smallii]|uniref:K Homology domain-containing protein n=1 Tax=Penstemon smallii TaxID=265156 RepID=A0ABD3T800_9LAMI